MNPEFRDRVGLALLKRREELGLTLADLAADLKINAEYLAALESGEVERIPGTIFLKGFLKSYAGRLGLDAGALLLSAGPCLVPDEKPEPLSPAGMRRHAGKLKYAVVGAIVLFVALSWFKVAFITNRGSSDLERRLNSGFKVLTAAREVALHRESKKFLASEAGGTAEAVVVRAVQDCWVEVRDGDVRIFAGLLLAGESREFAHRKGMRVKLGNAGAAEVVSRGTVLKNLGGIGEVRDVAIE